MVGKNETNGGHSHQRHDQDIQNEYDNDGDDYGDTKPKKKRRVIKTGDKKYECPEADCGKSYSRAEHLYRHQLNHTPKQIYYCDFPGCDRHFVRADLCARHKERHTAKGSHLQRKDAFLHAQRNENQAVAATTSSPGQQTTSGASPPEPYQQQHHQQAEIYQPPAPMQPHQHIPQEYAHPNGDVYTQNGNMHLDPQLDSSALSYTAMNGGYQNMLPPATRERRPTMESYTQRPQFNMQSSIPYNNSLASPPPQQINTMYQQTPSYPSPSSTNFRSPNAYSTLPSLTSFNTSIPAYNANTMPRSGNILSPTAYSTSEQQPAQNSRGSSMVDFNSLDQFPNGYSMPVFGNDYIGFNRSPPAVLNDDWFAALLGSSESILDAPQPSPPGPEPMHNPNIFNTPLPKLDPDGTPIDAKPPSSEGSGTLLAHGLDITVRESIISEEKRLRLIALIKKRFNDSEELSGGPSREQILEGYEHDPDHVMSLQMLKVYMASFWVYIHPQMPILHRPTFNSETCPDLLLLAMMCLGASCLERTHSDEQTKHCADMSHFLAYHIRWEVFKDPEFRPTAKLWTFQTMLLLELFEKMYSTKTLHERAHIHHATTLIVMRRGSSLIGRSANEPPGSSLDPTRTPPGADGTINVTGQNTSDATWNRWITAEATRRVAFAAFIIDSTHATLFGHSAVMSPHDLKLTLPCDEALWAATSMAEVQRVEASLAANGFMPTTFIEGLKRTLAGAKVRTNNFGRQILMAGLLNVSWHMNQRDVQVSALGAVTTLGSQYKWRAPLTRAFDFWRRDFDEGLAKQTPTESWSITSKPASDRLDMRGNIFESRTCLHSLAHMAMHVDMIDCTVFAGSERVLGRIVTEQDRAAVQHRMRNQWAPSARARDSVFYALRFLYEVLIPEEDATALRKNPSQPPAFIYSARDDYLLNRPWVLYFAALIVWSYGYALDGPIRPSTYTLTSRDTQIFDMQRYLKRMGRVTAPDDLEKQKDRNSCLGLLMLLRQCFKEPRWELLHEAGDLLGNCIQLLLPQSNENKAYLQDNV